VDGTGWPKLSTLLIFDRSLSRGIPESVGQLNNLLSLDIHYSGLSGYVPESFSGLVQELLCQRTSVTLVGGIPIRHCVSSTRGVVGVTMGQTVRREMQLVQQVLAALAGTLGDMIII